MSAGAAGSRRAGEWVTHSTLREVYSSWWVELRIDDVERPDGTHTEHEIVTGNDAAGMFVMHPERGVLMIYRHRFMPDTWGWEVPGGALDDGEDAEVAARREAYEETGWQVEGDVELLASYHPSVGLVNQKFHLYLARDATHVGAPPEANEAAIVEWRAFEQVAADLRDGVISDGFSVMGVAMAFARNGLAHLLT
ncbi:MAG: NUDIX hydrolase [Actinomycetota bacterium]